ncbi:dihydroorotase [Candidatus Margulisiibacteriota bacterium]
MRKSLLIKGGRVLDPSRKTDEELDILVENGKISKVSKSLSSHAGGTIEVINAKGKLVIPGLVDMHCHLRDPGNPDEETIYSGTRSAAAGGFTSVACMANTDPVADEPSVIDYIISKAKNEGVVNVFPIAAVTRGLSGEELTEMGMLVDVGAVAFSDDGNPVMEALILRKAMEYLKQFNKTMISHCEDRTLSEGGQMNEGYTSTSMGLKGIPAAAESVMVERDIRIFREFGGKGSLHIAHVSTASSVKLIREAKAEGLNITCETCPHYFTLTETEVEGYNTLAKVNPPLRTENDVKEVIKGLKDGTIDVIATDHAPHLVEEKNLEFNHASNGMVGFETALSLVLTELVDTEALTLSKAIAKMTSIPAKILGIPRGTLAQGSAADITIVDLNRSWAVDISKFYSKGKNSPFGGWKLKGTPIMTVVGGEIVMKDGKVLEKRSPGGEPPKFLNINKR